MVFAAQQSGLHAPGLVLQRTGRNASTAMESWEVSALSQPPPPRGTSPPRSRETQRVLSARAAGSVLLRKPPPDVSATFHAGRPNVACWAQAHGLTPCRRFVGRKKQSYWGACTHDDCFHMEQKENKGGRRSGCSHHLIPGSSFETVAHLTSHLDSRS